MAHSSFEPDPGEVVHEDKVDHDSDVNPEPDTPSPFVPAALTRLNRTMQQPQRYGEPVAHMACFALITVPRNYRDIGLMSQEDQSKWYRAMVREHDQLVNDHKTWELREKLSGNATGAWLNGRDIAGANKN